MNDPVESSHVKTVRSRAAYLKRKLDATSDDYNGRLYDQHEYDALVWLLAQAGFAEDRGGDEQPPRRDEIAPPRWHRNRADDPDRPPRASRYFPGGHP